MAGDRPSQEGRDEPVFPKPQSSSRATFILWLNPLNRVRPLPPNVNPLPRWNWPPVWLPARVVMRRCRLLLEGLKLTSAESAGQRRWGTQSGQTSRTILMKPEGTDQTRMLHLVMPLLTGLAQVALGDSSLWWLYWGEIEWTQLNFIIPF